MGQPGFADGARILVLFAAYKNHIGFYSTPSSLKAFAGEISKFKNGKGSVQFPFDKPLPISLIGKITEFRAKESKEGGVNWK